MEKLQEMEKCFIQRVILETLHLLAHTITS